LLIIACCTICTEETKTWTAFRIFLKPNPRESKSCPWSFCSYQSIWQLSKRGRFCFRALFIKIVKSVLKSRFCAISSDFCDFTWFQPDFIHFWFFQAIQPVMHVLTRKIVRFYESKRDFNNLALKFFFFNLISILIALLWVFHVLALKFIFFMLWSQAWERRGEEREWSNQVNERKSF